MVPIIDESYTPLALTRGYHIPYPPAMGLVWHVAEPQAMGVVFYERFPTLQLMITSEPTPATLL